MAVVTACYSKLSISDSFFSLPRYLSVLLPFVPRDGDGDGDGEVRG